MLNAYFVVARSSNNIIRLTRRDKTPDDSDTVIHVYATASQLKRYVNLLARGRDLISVNDASSSEPIGPSC